MKRLRLALAVLGASAALLGVAVALFALSRTRLPDIGSAYVAVMILASSGTAAAAGLFVGSALGTTALLRHTEARRAPFVLAILAGWIAAFGLGWLAWAFWSNSFRTPGAG